MYISELTMHGFKSFAKKDVLHFGEGITAIVGPNGCGKTNIVDAIRWVLGEQKYSVLRSGKMEDVIFNGAKNTKPLSVCEVTLTVHNNKGKLPIEYNDIEIGRRLYRNGESEYFMNRATCRLRDIQDLFVDTGMGSDAYSVIELKMIEQILSETGDDRRRMFEEAAGINKYKHQRRSTLRKFEATRTDLNRISDLINEIEAKVKALALQLKRFERHAKLLESLKDKEMSLAFLQIHGYKIQVQPLQSRIEELNHLRDSNVSDESVHEKELIILQTVYKGQQDELEKFRNQLSDFNDKREGLQNDIIIWKEQSRSAIITMDRLIVEQDKINKRKDELQDHLSDYKKVIIELQPKIDSGLNSYKQKQFSFEEIDRDFKEMQTALDSMQDKRWDLQQKLSDKKSLFDLTNSIIQEKTDKISLLKERILGFEKDLHSISRKIEIKKNTKTSISEKLGKNKNRLDKKTQELERLQYQKQQIDVQEHKVSSRIESLDSKCRIYEELLMSREGYPNGAKDILENKDQYKGVLGTVGDLLKVDDSIAPAIEMALGEYAKCIVVKDRKNAINIIEIARKRNAGNLMIIPLKDINDEKQNAAKLRSDDNLIGRAVDFVETTDLIKPLSRFLLGNILLVKDLKIGIKDNSLNNWDLVDTKGAFSIRGMIINNSNGNNEAGLIGRKEKIINIKRDIKNQKIQFQKLHKQSTKLEKSIEKTKQDIVHLDSQVKDLSTSQTEIDQYLVQEGFQQSQFTESISVAKKSIKENEQEIRSQVLLIDTLKSEIVKEEQILNKHAKEQTRKSAELIKIQSNRDQLHQNAQDLRIECLNLEGQRENVIFQQRTAEDSIKEFSARKSEILKEITQLKSQDKDLNKSILSAENKLSEINGMVNKQKSILSLKQETANDSYRQIEEIQAQIRSEQKNRETLLEELKQCELKIADFEQRINFVNERIKDRYDTEISNNMIVDETESELNATIERTERSIENIGPINMAVQAEHEEESSRLLMLSEQRDDLIEAEKNLLDTIQKIDSIAREKFQSTFENIRGNFEKLFEMFFEGGRGSLRLEGDPDPLEANIGIQAQPPGKRNQSLRQLSAGEKTLTAIALLFSIYQVKPSPYCILDEVDAPLDDVNIGKFTRVLNNFSDDTQFIVVTHNKLTMESANFLYGVTMENKGVSQLVSVKLD
ncbi:MAG: chromosome segregation protein SMC [Candidatus Neomarinimicrobiota bacterium]